MSQLQKTISLLSLLFVISACGLKGDLYLPEAQPQVVDSTLQEIENTTNDSIEIEAVPADDKIPDSTQAE